MNTTKTDRTHNLRPGDRAEVRFDLTVANETDGAVQLTGIRWAPILEGGSPLTRAEERTVALLAQDLGNREIAGLLGVKEQTVKFHITNALRKLGLRGRVGLAVWYALRNEAVIVQGVRERTARPEPPSEPKPERCWTCEYREVAEQAALCGLTARVVDGGVIVVPNGRAIRLRTLDDLEALKTEMGSQLSVGRTV